jgi:hypothetical protein
MDDIALNGQILVDELGRITVVGADAANLGRSQKNVCRPLLGKKID